LAAGLVCSRILTPTFSNLKEPRMMEFLQGRDAQNFLRFSFPQVPIFREPLPPSPGASRSMWGSVLPRTSSRPDVRSALQFVSFAFPFLKSFHFPPGLHLSSGLNPLFHSHRTRTPARTYPPLPRVQRFPSDFFSFSCSL